jgi:hypothetical protein
MREKNDQSKKIFILQLYHPDIAQSCLVSEAKQGQAWLVLRREKDLQRRLLIDKQLGREGEMPSKFKWSHWCQTSQK